MELPYEIQENIIKDLSYYDIVNYGKTNTKAMEVCDGFFRRKAKIENIPIELLPASNVASRYLQLYDDRESLYKIKYKSDLKRCFERLILEDDIEEIKWLVFLMKESGKFYFVEEKNISELSIHAFNNHKNIICKWLLSNLHGYDLNSNRWSLFVYNLYVILRFALEENRTEIIYYILDEFSGIDSGLRQKAFSEFTRAKDLINMKKVMAKYNMNISEYNYAIVNLIVIEMKNNDPEYLTTLRFLLQNYPGNNDDLNGFLNGFMEICPGRSALPILEEYGFNNYMTIFYRIVCMIYPDNIYIDNFKWFMLNYSKIIPISTLKETYANARDNKIRSILLEYISQRHSSGTDI